MWTAYANLQRLRPAALKGYDAWHQMVERQRDTSLSHDIFIGSASESLEFAKVLAEEMSRVGLRPIRWWTELPPGQMLFSTLSSWAKRVDGAVFILTDSDRTWYRDHSGRTPRDNVVLEWGLFAGQLGFERVLLVANEGVPIPRDIDGVTYLKRSLDDRTTAEQVARRLLQVVRDALPPVHQDVLILADMDVAKKTLRDVPPPRWHQRSLYYGTEGAQAWLRVSEDPTYISSDWKHSLSEKLGAAVRDQNPRTLVSFGPGDGYWDRELLQRLLIRNPLLAYVPVDLSDGLLQVASAELARRVRIPVAILSDFEDNMPFIERIIRSYSRPPRLYALLGNTLGNLDEGETNFLNSIAPSLREGGALILEVSIFGSDWSPERDPRRDPNTLIDGYKRLFSIGIGRRARESAELVYEKIATRLIVSQGQGTVPKSHQLVFHDSSTRVPVYAICRYDWKAFLAWLLSTFPFDVVFETTTETDKKLLATGIAILKYRQ